MPCATPPMVGTSRAPSRRSQARRSLVEPGRAAPALPGTPGAGGTRCRGGPERRVPHFALRSRCLHGDTALATLPRPESVSLGLCCHLGGGLGRGDGAQGVRGTRSCPQQDRASPAPLLLPEAQAAPHCIQGILSPQPCARCPQALGTEQPVMPAMLTCLPCARGRGDRSAAHQRQERVCPHQ